MNGWASPSAHCSQLPDRAGQPEHRALRPLGVGPEAGHLGLVERRLPGQFQGDLDDLLDVLGVEPQFALGLVELVSQLALICLARSRSNLNSFRTGSASVSALLVSSRVRRPEHRLLDLLGDHRADLAEVFPDRLDLADGPHQEFEVGFEVADLRLGHVPLPVVVPLADEVVDPHPLRLLAVPVDAAVALLQAVRVPGDLEVDHAGAVVLEVDALGGGVGGQQDADGTPLGVGLERRLDPLPVLRVHAAVHRHQPVAAGEPLGGEDALQPVLGGPVLGEDDDPLVGPLAAGPDVLVEPADQPLGLGVELRRWPVPPTTSSP